MPNFIIECSSEILQTISTNDLLNNVHGEAMASGLFAEDNIKVRVAPFEEYLVAGAREDFVHVFAYIMEGRSEEQKLELSKSVVGGLQKQFPQLKRITMNVEDFRKSNYFNCKMLD